jgi:hypothetical protein
VLLLRVSVSSYFDFTLSFVHSSSIYTSFAVCGMHMKHHSELVVLELTFDSPCNAFIPIYPPTFGPNKIQSYKFSLLFLVLLATIGYIGYIGPMTIKRRTCDRKGGGFDGCHFRAKVL